MAGVSTSAPPESAIANARSALAPPRPIRIVFSGHDQKFLPPFIQYFENDDRYEVRIDSHKGHVIDSEAHCRQCVAWADVIFCEWALGNLVWYSRNKRPNQLLLSRLHLQEWQHRDRISYLYDTDWERVDKLLLTSHHIYDHMTGEFPTLRGSRSRVMYCPIDALGMFNRQKQSGAAFNLGIVGVIPKRKRLDLALEILTKLLPIEPRLKLYVKSRRPEEYPWMRTRTDEMAWYQEIYAQITQLPKPDAVIFDSHGDDMPEWFTKIGFLLSTSDFEGSHQSVAEAMAGGCIPIIRDWEGANRLYPARYVWSDIDDAVHIISSCLDHARYVAEAQYSRSYAHEHFRQDYLCQQLEALILTHLRTIAPELAIASDRRRTRASIPTVLILGYLPTGYRSGYRIRLEQLARVLIKMGCTVHIACLHPPADAASLAQHRNELEKLSCCVHLIASKHFFNINVTQESFAPELRELENIVEQCGVDIVQGEALYSTRLALLLRERCPGLRVAFDCHGISPEEERMDGAHPNRIEAIEACQRKALRDADLSIFVSSAMRHYYSEKYGFSRHPYALVPCCVAEAQFPVRGHASPLQLPRDHPVVAYLGSLVSWQCGEEAIRLFSQLHQHDSSLFFLLLIPEKDHSKALAWIAQYRLPGHAVLLQELPHEQVAPVLAQADVGVLLRRKDLVNEVSSPTKFAEYLAAGMPVIITDCVGDYSQLVRSKNVGLVMDADALDQQEFAASLVERITELVDDVHDNRAQFAARCQKIAREYLHLDSAVSELLAAYKRILLDS